LYKFYINHYKKILEQNFNISDEAVVNLPEDVKKFILSFHRNLLSRSVFELHYIYENLFNKLTEKYYTKQAWPEPELIAGLVGDGKFIFTKFSKYHINIF
jgi:translation initiation factor 3 subunit L